MIEIGNLSASTQLYFSGGVHGDERVGPHAVLEAAELLCSNQTDIDLTDNLIVLTPITNVLGFALRERGENGRDPNRDFPFDQEDGVSSSCLETVTARLVHRIFYHYRRIVAGITFHGGDQSISYPWGSKSHEGDAALDQPALHLIAKELQKAGGGSDVYKIGSMEEVVYTVNGGMEDWAYALGIEGEKLLQCEPSSFGGYDSKKYTENVSLPSAAMFLVESSNEKSPPESFLGSNSDLRTSSLAIPRCVRMILALIKVVNPSVSTVAPISVNGNILIYTWGFLLGEITAPNCPFFKSNDITAIPQKILTDCGQLVITDRVPQGHLPFLKNRSREISHCDFFEPGICFLGDTICVSRSFLAVSPQLLLLDRPSIELVINGGAPIRFSKVNMVLTSLLPNSVNISEPVSVRIISASGPSSLTLLVFLLVPCALCFFFVTLKLSKQKESSKTYQLF